MLLQCSPIVQMLTEPDSPVVIPSVSEGFQTGGWQKNPGCVPPPLWDPSLTLGMTLHASDSAFNIQQSTFEFLPQRQSRVLEKSAAF